MPPKTPGADLLQREQRQRRYSSAAPVSVEFPGVQELILELRFAGSENRSALSPYRQIFQPGMQAYFELPCPSRYCSGGGFDLHDVVADAVARAASDVGGISSGRLQCEGLRRQPGAAADACPVEMLFSISVVKAASGR